ncbi:MAG: glycosyltransferase [Bacteroidetes bacterium]|nr:glycosyltransferase [Bacteroidota bacterium]
MSDLLTVQLPQVGYDLSHRRHFFEAVERDPGVRVVRSAGERFDVTFVGSGRPGLGVHWYNADPHTLACEIEEGIAPFLDARMVSLLPLAGLGRVVDYLHSPMGWVADIKKMNPNRYIPSLDTCDILLVPMFELFKTVLQPRLKHAKLLWKPWGVPGWIFHPPAVDHRPVDVFFQGSESFFYPLRVLMLQRLHQEARAGAVTLNHVPRMTHEDDAAFRADYAKFDDHQRSYADSLRRAKVFPFCPGVGAYPVQKYLEAMACGCLVVAPLPRDAELLGFVDGKTTVDCGPDDFMEKIYHYLQHEDERRAIADRAAELVLQRYTCEAQVRTVMGQLRQVLDGAAVESLDGGFR